MCDHRAARQKPSHRSNLWAMKTCPYCGLENPDQALQCGTCHTALSIPPPPLPERKGEYVMPPEERRFWERITFRQFALLMVRLQAVWFLYYAVLDLTYLPYYLTELHRALGYPSAAAAARRDLFFALLRVILSITAAAALIQNADRLLSWLVKDWFAKQPSDLEKPSGVGPAD
jgi:hypothetical protein